MSAITNITQKIHSRYNPEFDLIPDGPRVTWAEEDLAHAVDKLLARIEELEKQVESLKAGGFTDEQVAQIRRIARDVMSVSVE